MAVYPNNAPRGGATVLVGNGSASDVFSFAPIFAMAAPTLATAAGGTLSQPTTFGYVLTAIDPYGHESPLGTMASVATTSTNKTVNFPNLPLAPSNWEVTGRNLYRTSDGGVTWAKLTTINDNTSLTLTIGNNTAGITADTGAVAPAGAPNPGGGTFPPLGNVVTPPVKLVVQNNTAATIYVVAGVGGSSPATQGDEAVTAGSEFTSVGLCSWVAIYGAAATHVNGTAAGGIVVYGAV